MDEAMIIKIEATVEVPDGEILDAIDKGWIKNRDDVVSTVECAEFKIELNDMNFRFNIDGAEAQ